MANALKDLGDFWHFVSSTKQLVSLCIKSIGKLFNIAPIVD